MGRGARAGRTTHEGRQSPPSTEKIRITATCVHFYSHRTPPRPPLCQPTGVPRTQTHTRGRARTHTTCVGRHQRRMSHVWGPGLVGGSVQPAPRTRHPAVVSRGPGPGAGLARTAPMSPEIVLTAGSRASRGHCTPCLGPGVLELTEPALQNSLSQKCSESAPLTDP